MKNQSRITSLALAGLTALLLFAGCDEPTDSNEPVSSTLRAVGTRYFPVAEGMQRSYRTLFEDNSNSTSTRDLQFGAPVHFEGQLAWPMTETIVNTFNLEQIRASYFASIHDTLYAWFEDGPSWVPYDLYTHIAGASAAGDTLMFIENETAYTLIVAVSMNETVTVEAGQFENCLETLMTYRWVNTAEMYTDSFATRSWYAPGVGQVKSLANHFILDGDGPSWADYQTELVEFHPAQ